MLEGGIATVGGKAARVNKSGGLGASGGRGVVPAKPHWEVILSRIQRWEESWPCPYLGKDHCRWRKCQCGMGVVHLQSCQQAHVAGAE